MISVDEARALVLALAPAPQAEDIPVAEGLGRALLSPAVAALTQPPFDASAMDGWAVRAADLDGGARLTVVGESAAGRGFDAHIATEFDAPLPESACVYCGNCIGVCPTGALKSVREHELREAVERGFFPDTQQVDVR